MNKRKGAKLETPALIYILSRVVLMGNGFCLCGVQTVFLEFIKPLEKERDITIWFRNGHGKSTQ